MNNESHSRVIFHVFLKLKSTPKRTQLLDYDHLMNLSKTFFFLKKKHKVFQPCTCGRDEAFTNSSSELNFAKRIELSPKLNISCAPRVR
jgi:hypothetical protein